MNSFCARSNHPSSFLCEKGKFVESSNSHLKVGHSHPSYSYIIKHFDELITDQDTIKKIQRVLIETRECLKMIKSNCPVEPTKENASLIKALKKTAHEDKAVIRFLEIAFIQLSLKQSEEIHPKVDTKKHRKFFK